MNIPGPRKQPSVSPPGQVQGQPQIRAPHHYTARAPTAPVNIRSATPGPQLHYQRYPGYSQSPSGIPQLGNSPHQPVGAPLAQTAQPPQQLQIRSVTQPPHAVAIISPDTHVHQFLAGPSVSGPQVAAPQQQPTSVAPPRPQTIQLTTQPVVYTGQNQQNFQHPQGAQQVFTGPNHIGQGHQQQQQQQQQQQSGPPPSYQAQQPPQRFQAAQQTFIHRQRPPTPQQSEVQVVASAPQAAPQQVLLSQQYTQGAVPHDINKAPLGTNVAPPRGQTPPQSSLQPSAIMYNSRPQQPGTYVPARNNVGQNMQAPRQPVNAPMLQPVSTIFVPQMGQMIVQQPNHNAQIQQVQYPTGQRMQQPFAVTSQPNQQQMYGQQYYPTNNPGVPYMAAPNAQWQHQQQMRMQSAPVTTVSSQQNNYERKRERKIIKITDPTTGADVNLGDIASETANKSSGTPPQTSTGQQNTKGSIAAQFATQVIAKLATDKSGPQTVPSQQPQAQPQAGVQPGLQGSGTPHQVPPGAPPQQQQAPPQQAPQMVPVMTMIQQQPRMPGPRQVVMAPPQQGVIPGGPMVQTPPRTVLTQAPPPQPAPVQAPPTQPAPTQAPPQQPAPVQAPPPTQSQGTPVVIATPPVAEPPVQSISQQAPAQATPKPEAEKPVVVEPTPEVPPPSEKVPTETTPVAPAAAKKEATPEPTPAPEASEPVSAPAAEQPVPAPASQEQAQEASKDTEESSAPTPQAPQPQREDPKDRRKKNARARSRELNAKSVEGSDMDAFTDNTEKAPSPTETPEQVKSDGASATPKQNTPEPTQPVEKPSRETPTETTQTPAKTVTENVNASDETQRRVAERNEKNSKEHAKVESEAPKEAPETVAKENNVSEEKVKPAPPSEEEEKTTEPVIKKDPVELKYKYREDQWSPLNPEGKKLYDRSFLLQLQYASESLAKPYGLPQLPDVVLDVPITSRNERQLGQSQMSNSKGLDFTPAYVMQGNMKPPIHKRNSHTKGRREGGPEPRKVINLQIQEVKLHQTENAWKPSVGNKKDSEDPEVTEREELFKKVRSILNKLTPQKFQKLLAQVMALGINTEEKLAGTIDITFEKAISEPNFSVAYANLCKCLNNLKVQQKADPNQSVSFRKLLLNRCQKEFEKDNKDALDLAKMQEDIDNAPQEKKKELTELKEMAEYKARKRSLGNIRFIGELFKLRMLTETIMHDCLVKLLRSEDEDSLEALCNLLKTIGKDLDVDRSKEKLDGYYAQLQKIVDAKKYSSRLRFMILDAIDLRKDNWVPRREDNNPKTIEQIHREAQQEEQQKQLLLQTIPHQSKSKSRGGRGSQTGPQHNQTGEDGWTPVKPQRTPAIDPAKMKITKQPMDENIQLGPGGRPGSFGTWGRGSSGGSKQSSKESEKTPAPGNRYMLLSGGGGMGGSDGYEGGRLGPGGRGASLGPPSSRDSKGRSSQGRDRGKLVSRPSQEQERESALAAVRNLSQTGPDRGGRRTPGGSRNQSRESSRNREPPSRDRSLDQSGPVRGPPAQAAKELPIMEIEKKSISLIDEYLAINDSKEALQCIRELESPQNIHMGVNTILTHVLERSAKARQMSSHLLHEALKQKVLTADQYTRGLTEILQFADDMAIDIPQIWKYLGELIGPMIEDGVWHISNLRPACKVLLPFNKAGVLVAEVLNDVSHRLGHIKVGEMWRSARMNWSDFLSSSDNVKEFLKKHKMEFTMEDEVPRSPEASTMSMERVQKELEKLVIEKEAVNEVVFDWINANVADSRTREPQFIRALMTAVCSGAINGRSSSCKVEPECIKKRCILLQRYLDHDAKLELQALYALQALVHKLEHPPEVLRVFFDTLYDEDIISEDAFYQWESSSDPAEQAGKGVAVSSVVQFFTWLREAEEDDPEAANK